MIHFIGFCRLFGDTAVTSAFLCFRFFRSVLYLLWFTDLKFSLASAFRGITAHDRVHIFYDILGLRPDRKVYQLSLIWFMKVWRWELRL